MSKEKNKCIFCEKDLSKEKFREDYTLIAWRNDPEDPKSLNKIAKCCHPKCLKEFVKLNFQTISRLLVELFNPQKRRINK